MGKAGRELVVRASSRKEGWEKNLYGEQFAGLIDGDGCASVKSSCSRFKKKNRPVSFEMPDIHRSLPLSNNF